MLRWINLTNGVPVAADFGSTSGAGTPICIDKTTGTAYYLSATGTVLQVNRTVYSVFRVNSPAGVSSQIRQYSTVNGANYGFSETTLGLTNPAAATPDVLLYSFGAEGTYTAGGAVTSRDFYIFDDVTNTYVLYTDGNTGAVKLGGTDALTAPALTIAKNGALTVPEVAAASVPSPAAGYQSLFIDTADHKLKRKDSGGTVTIIA